MMMAKASQSDIDAAGEALSVLNDISGGYYPAREDDEDAPTFFDPEDPAHLRKFYDLMNATLVASQGWPMRVIGGMCFVILYDKNEIVDPASDTLELHPKLVRTSDKLEIAPPEPLGVPREWFCEFHGQAKSGEWGCPFCVTEMREKLCGTHKPIDELTVRGELAAQLTFWHRMSGADSDELVRFVMASRGGAA